MTHGASTSGQSTGQDESSHADLTALARNVAFLASIYLYFMGWAYLYLYYRHFGVALLGLDIPVGFFFAYAYPIVTTGLTFTNAVLALIFIFMMAIAIHNSKRFLVKLLMFFLTLALFPLSFKAAQDSADTNAINFRQGYGARAVRLTFSPEAAKSYPRELIEANENHELFLLLQTKERLYVVHQPPPLTPRGELPIASTYSIESDSVSLADVDLTNVSPKEQAK